MSDFEKLSYTPDGWVSVIAEVHTNGSDIIILGNTPPDTEGELAHNCDAMGCGQMHVIGQGTIDWDNHKYRAKEIVAALQGGDFEVVEE